MPQEHSLSPQDPLQSARETPTPSALLGAPDLELWKIAKAQEQLLDHMAQLVLASLRRTRSGPPAPAPVQGPTPPAPGHPAPSPSA